MGFNRATSVYLIYFLGENKITLKITLAHYFIHSTDPFSVFVFMSSILR